MIKGDADGLLTERIGEGLGRRRRKAAGARGVARARSDFPDVPNALELVKGDKKAAVEAIINMLDMHRGFYAPPDTNPDAVRICARRSPKRQPIRS